MFPQKRCFAVSNMVEPRDAKEIGKKERYGLRFPFFSSFMSSSRLFLLAFMAGPRMC